MTMITPDATINDANVNWNFCIAKIRQHVNFAVEEQNSLEQSVFNLQNVEWEHLANPDIVVVPSVLFLTMITPVKEQDAIRINFVVGVLRPTLNVCIPAHPTHIVHARIITNRTMNLELVSREL